MRTGILEESEFIEYDANKLILQQDADNNYSSSNNNNKDQDNPRKLYIILRGSVNIKIATVSNSGEVID